MATICIIGGGAAGFFAALAAAETNPSASIIIFEAGKRTLEKVAISGGGRCNVTHHCFDVREFVKAYPRGAKELLSPFSKFQAKDTVDWFLAHGVQLKTEEDGRMFPTTDSSATIVNCLEQAANTAHIRVETETKVTAITRDDAGFSLQIKDQPAIFADRVLIASGSAKTGYEIAKSLGHTIVEPVPSLFTFKISDPRSAGLEGVSVPSAKLVLKCPGGKTFSEEGPLLITHWGLSGPAVLKLSAWAARELYQCNYKAPLQVNWLGISTNDVLAQLQNEKTASPRRQITSYSLFALPKRLWTSLLRYIRCDEELKWADISNKLLLQFAEELTAGKFMAQGKGAFKDEFVTCGGVLLREVDFRTMESKLVPGLHFAGEVLDIDALTGGFNFQAAWTTGWIAGREIGK